MDFVPSLPTFLAFSLAILLLALTPGPDMTLWISRSLRDGRSIGLMVLAGTSFGISVHTILVAFGISRFLPFPFLNLKKRCAHEMRIGRLPFFCCLGV